jgi:hypothetical protein
VKCGARRARSPAVSSSAIRYPFRM